MKRNKALLVFGLLIMAVFIAFSLFPHAIAPYGAKDMFKAWVRPSAGHLLGTNDMGYDIFSELVYASSSSMIIGVSAAVISLVIGSSVGILAGYFSGWRGAVAGGVIQVFLLIPMLPMAIVIAAFCGASTGNIILTISLLGWCATARTVRTRTMQLKQTAFVESLMILGLSKSRIMFRHIIPNLREVVLSRYIMSVARCMMLEATLSFIGLGDPTHVTWGRMVNLAYSRGGFTRGAYYWLVSPGICITLVVLAFYCINRYLDIKNDEVSGKGGSYLE